MTVERRVCLIRAVNVGGTAKVPMADLRELATGLGATHVETWIQSGNLLCVPPGDPEAFDRALERAIEARFGFFREVISRSRTELEQALADHPFDRADERVSFIAFLQAAPTPEAIALAAEVPTGDDRWQVIGRDLHQRYAQSIARPQMNATAIAKRLGVPGTARNLRTVAKLIELAAPRPSAGGAQPAPRPVQSA